MLLTFENFIDKHLCWSLFLIKLQVFNKFQKSSYKKYPISSGLVLLENPRIVFQKRLGSFYQSLLEISMMKRGSVFRKNQIICTAKFNTQKQALYFWLCDESSGLNICPLYWETIEFVKLSCFCKHIKIYQSGISSQDSVFTHSCIVWHCIFL